MLNTAEGPTRAEIYKRVPIPGTKRFLAWLDGKEASIQVAQDTLNAAFVGKAFHGYIAAESVAAKATALMKGSPFHEEKRATWIHCKRVSPSEVALVYKERQIAQIYFKKKKGAKHWNWFGSQCEWTYEKVCIQQWPDSVKATLDWIDEWELKQKIQKETEKEKNLVLLSKIFPLLEGSYYDKFRKLEELAKLKYASEAELRLKNK